MKQVKCSNGGKSKPDVALDSASMSAELNLKQTLGTSHEHSAPHASLGKSLWRYVKNFAVPAGISKHNDL